MAGVIADIDRKQGEAMHAFVRELFPICRSLTGDGNRQTLRFIKRHLPKLEIHEVATGTQVFDWTIPDEWNVRTARLFDHEGQVIVDFADNNLHLVGYSEPVDRLIDLNELQSHLYSLPEQPDAIPYVTSYYKRGWGFCLTHRRREQLKPGTYRAVIDSTLAPGHLTYGELLIAGSEAREVFFSTYICHPSMANNELSGPAVATWLAKWLSEAPRRWTYRFVFIPETIGSIAYLSRNLSHLKKHVYAGFNVSCVGDDRTYSYMPSRHGDTPADRVARHVLQHTTKNYQSYTFLDRGSDERQYCAPGVDLPVCSVMRSKYGTYPEYHTSLDDLALVTPTGLAGGLQALVCCVVCLEANDAFRTTVLGEPQLGKRGLYPLVSTGARTAHVSTMMNILAYADGAHDLLAVADILGAPMWQLLGVVETLQKHGLLVKVTPPSQLD